MTMCLAMQLLDGGIGTALMQECAKVSDHSSFPTSQLYHKRCGAKTTYRFAASNAHFCGACPNLLHVHIFNIIIIVQYMIVGRYSCYIHVHAEHFDY